MSAIAQYLDGRRVKHSPPPSSRIAKLGIGFAGFLGNSQPQEILRQIPVILEAVTNLLPESGPKAADRIYALARNVLEAKKAGYNDQEISAQIIKTL